MECVFGRFLPGDTRKEVTFRQFLEVAKRRKLDVAGLTAEFRGKIDNPRELFERIFADKENFRDVVIPYSSVLAFYNQEQHYVCDSNSGQRFCTCGCGLAVFGRRNLATEACKKRVQRRNGHGPQKAVLKK
jgi:hypothetical protein